MTDDDKKDETENIGGTLRKPSETGKLHGRAFRPISLESLADTAHTATSSAYVSAELFNPEQAPMIKAYQDALKQADKGDVFALWKGNITPRDVGINTALEPKVYQTYAEFEYSEIQTRETREHEKAQADEQGKKSRRHDLLMLLIGAALPLIGWLVKALLSSGSASP